MITIYAPFDEYCGYGARARDLANCTKYIKNYDFEFVDLCFGNSPRGFLEKENEEYIKSKLTTTPKNELSVVINIPAPNQNFGKKNILITTGIETDILPKQYVEFSKGKDLILTSSVFSKSIIDKFVPDVPCKVLFEAYDPVFLKNPRKSFLENCCELNFSNHDFIFLCVGHWLPGDLGHDRKNIGFTISCFYKAFANLINPPALLIKTQVNSPSHLDTSEICGRIKTIRNSIKANWYPEVYLLSGNLSNEEMNALYRHKTIKAFTLLSHGEGYGRPYLEFSLTGKPIIASNYSGQLDFLNSEQSLLVDGKIDELHKSSKYHPIFEEGSKWFFPKEKEAINAYRLIHKKYNRYLESSTILAETNKKEFTMEKMAEKFNQYLKLIDGN